MAEKFGLHKQNDHIYSTRLLVDRNICHGHLVKISMIFVNKMTD